MEIKGKTPRGSQNRNHWYTDKLTPGQSFDGWVAGFPLCVQCHDSENTKPCLKRYTGFDVSCPGCASRKRLVDIIFLPLYRDVVLQQCVVPFRFAMKATIEKLNLHNDVTVTRPKRKSEGRWLERRKREMKLPITPEIEMPKCIAEWLPVVWGYTDRITGTQLLNGPIFDSPAAVQMVSDAPNREQADDEAKMNAISEQQRRARLKGKTEHETITNVLNDKVQFTVQPKSNGTH